MYRDMEQWTEIRRRVLVEGVSKRQILRETGMHWSTLQKILTNSAPPGYRQSQPRPQPKIGPYRERIQQILMADRELPRKQRHTAKRIWERLQEEGYTGGYTAVREAVREAQQQSQEVFVPLVHRPGEAQVDFGEALVRLAGRLRVVKFFLMALPYSDAFFVMAFERECTETFGEGHVQAFRFFGGVPSRISYDNTRIAVAQIFVTVPQVRDFDELNAYLLQCCQEDLSRRLRGQTGAKAELLVHDRAAFLPLPAVPFVACRNTSTTASSLSLVRFDDNDYSVPVRRAHHPVVVHGDYREVVLCAGGQEVARHRRIWEREQVCFEPLHYLALLERKPGALDHARPLAGWELPECFATLRRRLENERTGDGTREYIRVLRLLEKHSLAEVRRAVEQALPVGAVTRDAVAQFLWPQESWRATVFRLDGHPHLRHVQVATADLNEYRSLLCAGGVR